MKISKNTKSLAERIAKLSGKEAAQFCYLFNHDPKLAPILNEVALSGTNSTYSQKEEGEKEDKND